MSRMSRSLNGEIHQSCGESNSLKKVQASDSESSSCE